MQKRQPRHSNARYELKGKTKMWDVFPNNMGFYNNIELTLANLDLNEPMLQPISFNYGDPLEWSSSTPLDASIGQDLEGEEDGVESNNNGGDLDNFDIKEDGK